MSKNRYINTKFWDDSYITNLDPIEKLLFLYFLTNPITNIVGIYEIDIKRIAFDTGIDKEMILKIIDRFSSANKIHYADNYVIIVNHIKNQNQQSEKIQSGIIAILDTIPDKTKKLFFRSLKGIHTLPYLIKYISNYNRDTETPAPQKLNADEVIEGKSDIPLKIVGNIQFDYIKNDWNNFAQDNGLAVVLNLSDKRISNIKTRLTETNFEFPAILKKIAESPYLLGANDRNWKVNFDWIFSSTTNYLKILENNYRNNKQTEPEITPGFIPARDNR